MNALPQLGYAHAPSIVLTAEAPVHGGAIESLVDQTFGPERLRKTAYRLREDTAPVTDLGLVALEGRRLVGTIRYWEVSIAGAPPVLLLGPLAVAPDRQGLGIGADLMRRSLDNAERAGWKAVILVGDAPYYRRFGFRRDLAEPLALPGPVDPARFLARELVPGALEGAAGMVGRAVR